MSFVDYNGKVINIPEHSHNIANNVTNGFMSKEDKIKLDTLVKYKTTLIRGSIINDKLNSDINANATSIVFTKTKIPDNKISTAEIVSTNSSEIKCYMYLDGDIIYISPEKDDTIIYANEDCGDMFHDSSNKITSLDLSNFDTSRVTNMSEMFRTIGPVEFLDVSNFDTSNVTDMSYMFAHNLGNIKEIIGLNKFNTYKVTNMHSMFYYCYNLISILDLSGWNTSNVTDMHSMFYGCNKLPSLNISNFDTNKVTDMSEMFSDCESLTSLDVSSFNTNKVTDMHRMFEYCSSLKDLTGFYRFLTSNVTDMSEMFSGCRSLTSLKLSFNTSSATDMSYMFSNCNNLTTITQYMHIYATNTTNMFYNCYKLSGSIAIRSNTTEYASMFSGCSNSSEGKFIVDYINDATKLIAEKMIATNSSTKKNVVLGSLVR